MPGRPDDEESSNTPKFAREEKLLTSGEAAKYLDLNQRTFQRRVAAGEIKTVEGKLSSWQYFRTEDLDEYKKTYLANLKAKRAARKQNRPPASD